jgi:hypothetical protein
MSVAPSGRSAVVFGPKDETYTLDVFLITALEAAGPKRAMPESRQWRETPTLEAEEALSGAGVLECASALALSGERGHGCRFRATCARLPKAAEHRRTPKRCRADRARDHRHGRFSRLHRPPGAGHAPRLWLRLFSPLPLRDAAF